MGKASFIERDGRSIVGVGSWFGPLILARSEQK